MPAQCGVTPILLNDGRVLVVGGVQCLPLPMLRAGQRTSGALRLARLFDPTSLSFSTTGNLTEARDDPKLILLNNGQVLVVGGAPSFSGSSLYRCELYDPATGIFSKTGTMHRRRREAHAVGIRRKVARLSRGRGRSRGRWLFLKTNRVSTSFALRPRIRGALCD